MKKCMIAVTLAAAVMLVAASCAVEAPVDELAYEAQVDADFEAVVATLGTADAARAFAGFDEKYGTSLSVDFAEQLSAPRFSSGGTNYAELLDMPFAVDGAVYLSGGGEGLVSSVIGWVAPKSLPGGYYHGAVLDLDKFDPNNLEAASLQTAIAKGAGYESAYDWQRQVNACVLNPVFTVNRTRLNSAQSAIDYYCDPDNTDMSYGFFEGYVNIFNLVEKESNDWWYCTKTVWRMYDRYGIDVDSNSPRVDFSDSGLYSLVKAYYNARYFYSSSKAKAAIAAYIADARRTIVMAEEIMLSPYLSKVYEAIRAE